MQLLFAVSLLLALGAGTMWARAQWVTDAFGVQRTSAEGDGWVLRFLDVEFNRGCFSVRWGVDEALAVSAPPLPGAPASWNFIHDARDTDPFWLPEKYWWERLGFFRRSSVLFVGNILGVPPWFAVLAPGAVAVAPLLWLRRDARRRLRRSRGLCITCGYDLRGAAHERCPECGAGVEDVSRIHRGLPPAATSSRTNRGG